MPAIELKGLTKRFRVKVKGQNVTQEAGFLQRLLGRGGFGEILAVDHVNLSIEEGELFGLLGPNGAGKTTTIKMLCTLIEPTEGTASVNGYDIVKEADRVRASIGAVLEGERSLYWKLTARENLEFYASMYHVPSRFVQERIREVLDLVGLWERSDDLVERYSKGMKQRLAIAKALLHEPPVLLLDEPTLGLDPQAARHMREKILELKKEGHTIILTTHYMEEADQLCDRVAIIDLGKIIALGSPSELKGKVHETEVVELDVTNMPDELIKALRGMELVKNVVGRITDTVTAAGKITIHTMNAKGLIPPLMEEMGRFDAKLQYVRVKEPTLEDVFISLTGKKLRE